MSENVLLQFAGHIIKTEDHGGSSRAVERATSTVGVLDSNVVWFSVILFFRFRFLFYSVAYIFLL